MTPVEKELAARIEAVFAHPGVGTDRPSYPATPRSLPQPAMWQPNRREMRRAGHVCCCDHCRAAHLAGVGPCDRCGCDRFARALTGWAMLAVLVSLATFWFAVAWAVAR